MLIGLISDTHIPEAGKDISPEVRAAFSDVDLILHGGDITMSRVLDQLEEIVQTVGGQIDIILDGGIQKGGIIDCGYKKSRLVE